MRVRTAPPGTAGRDRARGAPSPRMLPDGRLVRRAQDLCADADRPIHGLRRARPPPCCSGRVREREAGHGPRCGRRRRRQGGDGRLTDADPAVVGRHVVVHEGPQSEPGQRRRHDLGQQRRSGTRRPSAPRCRGRGARRTGTPARRCRAPGPRGSRRPPRRGRASGLCPAPRRRSSAPGRARPWCRRRGRRRGSARRPRARIVARQRLELDGGLALVGDRVAQPEEAGHGVEQPSRTRGARPRPPLDQRQHGRPSGVEAGPTRAAASGPAAAALQATAMRHGSRMAAAPPGMATARRWPTRSYPARSATRISPPHRVPSGPNPKPSKARPRTGSVRPCSTMHDATCAWWCCTGHGSRPQVERPLGRQVLGVQVVRHHVGLDAEQRGTGGRSPGGRTGTWPGARGRRCGGWPPASRALGHRHGVLELGPHRQHLPPGRMREAPAAQGRSRATGAPSARASPAARTHRVVAPDVDGAVVARARRPPGGPGAPRRRPPRRRWGRPTGSRWS